MDGHRGKRDGRLAPGRGAHCWGGRCANWQRAGGRMESARGGVLGKSRGGLAKKSRIERRSTWTLLRNKPPFAPVIPCGFSSVPRSHKEP